jgi:hypothetical protein
MYENVKFKIPRLGAFITIEASLRITNKFP